VTAVVAFSSKSEWTDDRWVVQTTKENLYQDFAGWSSHVQSILHLMQTPDIWALFEHLPARTYTRGSAVIIGDAAHATTPHQGSGAGMAIEDAFVLGEIIKAVRDYYSADHLTTAFRAYEKVRMYRTQKLVSTSHEAGMLYEFELEGVGDDAGKIAENLKHRMRWIWEEDLEQEVKDAKGFLAAEVKAMYPRGQ
jgi:salicylate hydroxylase